MIISEKCERIDKSGNVTKCTVLDMIKDPDLTLSARGYAFSNNNRYVIKVFDCDVQYTIYPRDKEKFSEIINYLISMGIYITFCGNK